MSIIKCSSAMILKAELEVIRKKVSLQETGVSWNKIEDGILQLMRCCRNGGCAFETEMVAGIRSLSRPLNNAINSERSRLSSVAIELITALSAELGPAFKPLASVFMPSLLGLCARTNTVFTRRAKASIVAVIENTRLPSLLPYLVETLNHKSATVRLVAAKGVLTCLNCFNSPLKDTHVHLVENVIESTAKDARADVRKAGEKILEAYKALLPDHVESFIPLSTKRHSIVQGTAALKPIPQERSCGHPGTPVGSIDVSNTKTISQDTHQEVPRLRSGLRQSPVHSINTRRGIARPVVPIAQRPQRIAIRVAPSPITCSTAKAEPVKSIEDRKIDSRKQRARLLHAPSFEVPRDIPKVRSNQATSTRKDTSRLSELGTSSIQCIHQRQDVISPSISTTQHPRRTGNMVETLCDKARAGGGKRRVLVPKNQLEIAGIKTTQTQARKTRPLVKPPSAIGLSRKSVSKPKYDPKKSPVTAEVKLQTSSLQNSYEKVGAPRPSQQVAVQEEPEQGGHPVANDRPKQTFNALMDALCGAMNHNTDKLALEDIFLPPIRTAMICPTAGHRPSSPICIPRQSKPVASEPGAQLETTIDDMLVFQDISHPSYARLRRSSFRPRRQNFRTKIPLRDFLTSTPRKPLALPPSPFSVRGAKVIVHSHIHNSDISCFQGCELQ